MLENSDTIPDVISYRNPILPVGEPVRGYANLGSNDVDVYRVDLEPGITYLLDAAISAPRMGTMKLMLPDGSPAPVDLTSYKNSDNGPRFSYYDNSVQAVFEVNEPTTWFFSINGV